MKRLLKLLSPLLLCAAVLCVDRAHAAEPLPEGGGMPAFYPTRFSGMGRIDRFEGHEIVIDDSLYRLTSSARYTTPRRRSTTRSAFEVGQYIGFLATRGGKITSLWLLRERPKDLRKTRTRETGVRPSSAARKSTRTTTATSGAESPSRRTTRGPSSE